MEKSISVICAGLVLLFSAGCSSRLSTFESGGTIREVAASNLVEAQDQPQWAKQLENGVWDYFGQIHTAQAGTTNCRVKYHDSYVKNRWMVATGTINGSRQYPVVLDTGASQTVFIDKKHVRDNKLPVYNLPNNTEASQRWSLCNLTELTIGSVTLSDWPCFYQDNFSVLDIFGIRNAAFNSVILGLPVLREFNYIVFDGIQQEIEFSLNDSFRPDVPDQWQSYRTYIEEDFGGNVFLFIETTIASVPVELQLDTGSGRGLAASERLWSRVADNISPVRFKKAHEHYPYIGNLPCRYAVIGKLDFGGRAVTNAQVSVFNDDSPLVADCDGLVGMGYFADTVLVLDFENEMLWVKAQQSINEASCSAGRVQF